MEVKQYYQIYYHSTDDIDFYIQSSSIKEKAEKSCHRMNQEINRFLKSKGAYYFIKNPK